MALCHGILSSLPPEVLARRLSRLRDRHPDWQAAVAFLPVRGVAGHEAMPGAQSAGGYCWNKDPDRLGTFARAIPLAIQAEFGAGEVVLIDEDGTGLPIPHRSIRAARPEDADDWRGLWGDYLRFYGVELEPGVTEATWARLMDEGSALKARVAVVEGRVAGFAIHLHHPSTWVAGEDCYLEDLFVASTARGQGLGRALIEDLAALARARGWHRLYWHTDIANAAARRLYDSFCPDDGHIRYRMKL